MYYISKSNVTSAINMRKIPTLHVQIPAKHHTGLEVWQYRQLYTVPFLPQKLPRRLTVTSRNSATRRLMHVRRKNEANYRSL